MTVHEFQGEYRFLSNFWPAPVLLDDEEYPSVEHAYQAAKCSRAQDRCAIKHMTPAQAKRYARSVPIDPRWNEYRLQVMTALVRHKFLDHPDLAARLLATGDALLIEGNYWRDTFWGQCNNIGQNHLGRILMRVRAELREGA